MRTFASVDPLERRILFGAMAAFFVLLLAVPPWHRAALALCGAVAFGLSAHVAARLGPLHNPGKEPLAVCLAAFLALAMPVAILGPPRGRAFLAAGLGILVVQGLWAVQRYPAASGGPGARQRDLGRDLRWGAAWGLGGAVFYSLYALGIFLLGSAASSRTYFAGRAPWLVVAAYFAGGLAAGLLAGALRPLARRPLGAMLMGILGGVLIYGAVALVMPLIDEDTRDMSAAQQLLTALVCGLMVGPPAALSMRERDNPAPAS